jgi:sugar/nucleoside kinase (ribokinase family)
MGVDVAFVDIEGGDSGTRPLGDGEAQHVPQREDRTVVGGLDVQVLRAALVILGHRPNVPGRSVAVRVEAALVVQPSACRASRRGATVTAVLTVIGDLVEDIVVWTEGPTRRGTDNPAVVTRSRGGSAANVAAHAAKLAPTRFVGRVGDDRAGTWLTTELAATGVDVRVQRGGRTGAVVIVVDPLDGERTMYPDRGGAAELAAIDPAWMVGTTLVHVPAYGLVTEPAAGSILGAIDHARRCGAQLSIDASAVTVVERYGRDRFAELLDRLDPEIVLANAEEAAALSLASRRLSPGSVVVVKDGPRPAVVVFDDGTRANVDAEPVPDVRDTTGAGDAFAAGFLAAWLAGADPVEACRAAHRSATTVLCAAGAG